MTKINGIDVDKTKLFKQKVIDDSKFADREPRMVGHWVDGSATRIEFGDITSEIGGDGQLNAMQTLLASLAACDVDLIAVHSALIGLSIDKLWVEISGHFNVAAYLGIENAPGSGYDSINYTIHIEASQATPDQIKYLKERCTRSSPVGDSLARAIPLTLHIQTD